jgi:hypothetical protein
MPLAVPAELGEILISRHDDQNTVLEPCLLPVQNFGDVVMGDDGREHPRIEVAAREGVVFGLESPA